MILGSTIKTIYLIELQEIEIKTHLKGKFWQNRIKGMFYIHLRRKNEALMKVYVETTLMHNKA